MTAKKIFIGNYKGGVGKTTSTYYLAHYFAENHRVLLIDLDPQCSLSEICMNSVEGRELYDLGDECLNFVFDVYQKSKKYPNIQFAIDKKRLVKNCEKNHPNIDFIPANLHYENGGLDDLSMKLQHEQNGMSNLFILYQFISENGLDQEYDIILFDCPPSNNIITQSAFLLCDYYMIPTIMDKVSVKGVDHYITTIRKIYTHYCENHEDAQFIQLIFGEKPELLGIYETIRKGPSKPRGRELLVGAGYKIYETVIKDLVAITDSMSQGDVAEEQQKYKALADEILADIKF